MCVCWLNARTPECGSNKSQIRLKNWDILCLYMYVCMRVYVCVCISVRIHTYIHIHTGENLIEGVHLTGCVLGVCMYLCMCICVRIHTHVYTYILEKIDWRRTPERMRGSQKRLKNQMLSTYAHMYVCIYVIRICSWDVFKNNMHTCMYVCMYVCM